VGGARAHAWLWRRPPHHWFHLALVPPTLLLLWSVSVPGISWTAYVVGQFVLTLAALVWIVRCAGHAVAWHRGRREGRAAWIVVSPVCAVLTASLVVTDVPLRARWEASEDAFDEFVATLPEAGPSQEWRPLPPPGRLGWYDIRDVRQIGEAVILWEASGAFSDDAGFAFLPEGPFPELESGSFENPTFEHLGGPWYAWTASW
jgi:hypothetical protein